MASFVPISRCSGFSRPNANETLTVFDTGSVRGSLLCAPSPHLREAAKTLVRDRTRSGASLSGELFQTRGPDPVGILRTVSKTRAFDVASEYTQGKWQS